MAKKKKKPDYSDCYASVKAGDYVKWVKEKLKTGELTLADVSIVLKNREGTNVIFGKGLPQPPQNRRKTVKKIA